MHVVWLTALLLLLTTGTMSAQTQISVADGNGNVYDITPTALRYLPVKAAQSSSGTYDGGEPALRKITAEEYHAIVQAVSQLATKTKQHITERHKGSVAVHEKKDSTTLRSFILPMGDADGQALVAQLRQILQR